MANITVASTAALNAALHTAQDGDTILLKAGTYDGVSMNNLSFANGITLTSADPAHAVLTNFDMNNDHGLTLSNLELLAQGPGYYAFNIAASTNLHFDHISVHGSLDGDPQDDIEGFAISGGSNISVTNSEFQQLQRGLGINTSSNVSLTNNYIHDVEATGVVMAAVSNVTISGNAFANLHPATGDHPDAIQLETAGTTTISHDISITNNAIYRGTGEATQGIFFRDQVGTLPYQNVTIANNLIDGTGYGGIYIEGLGSGTISNNQLISNPGDTNKTVLVVQYSTNVAVNNNQAVSIGFDSNVNVTQSGNITNAAVSDNGLAALHDWLAANPGAATQFAPLVLGVSPPPPPIPGVNRAPSGADTTTALAWNATKVFAATDFGFTDPDNNHIAAVKLDSLPMVGSLTDNGGAVTAGQVISIADINAGKLVYQAPSAAAAAHADITFQVQDDGGTANGGVNLDPTANTLHIDVAALQVAPSNNTSPPPPPVSPPPPPAAPATGTSGQPTSTLGQNLTANAGHTQVVGGNGDDTLTGGATADYLRGGQGNDVITGGSAFNDMNGNQGNDTIHGGSGDNWVVGGQGNDMLFGGGGTNLILGNLGNDTLHAGSGNDILRGGQGDDVIFGGPGSDYISGDLGNNTETGGTGADTFHSFSAVGLDLVTNFSEAKGDHVELDLGTQYTVSQVGADTVINMVGGGEMILQGVQMATLHAGWLFEG